MPSFGGLPICILVLRALAGTQGPSVPQISSPFPGSHPRGLAEMPSRLLHIQPSGAGGEMERPSLGLSLAPPCLRAQGGPAGQRCLATRPRPRPTKHCRVHPPGGLSQGHTSSGLHARKRERRLSVPGPSKAMDPRVPRPGLSKQVQVLESLMRVSPGEWKSPAAYQGPQVLPLCFSFREQRKLSPNTWGPGKVLDLGRLPRSKRRALWLEYGLCRIRD